MKTIRNLSGIYYRSQDKETKKWGNVCFEDLPKNEQEDILKSADKPYLERLVLILAGVINDIGDNFDIMKD